MKPGMAWFPFLLIALACSAGDQTGTGMSEEDAVRSLDDQERIAALNRDVPGLERLWSDQLTVNAPNNAVLIDKDATMALVHGGVINFSSFERTIEFVRVDGNLAIVMGAETVQPVGNAPSFQLGAGQTVHRRFTNIWRKESGTWRLFIRHANVIPAG